MLSAKNNELLCRVGPQTPMGNMLREYWWPVLRSEKLKADGAPERIRLLGEDWVAFRASDGRVGVLDERCPHRSVSMALARNEDCALRCILHGWKISVTGAVLETPNEKDQSPARLSRLKVRHLPVKEAAGLIWVWPGKGQAPAFPNYAFAQASSTATMVGYYKCNWFQLIETLWDPSHVHVLHFQGDTYRDQFAGMKDVGYQRQQEAMWAAGFEARDHSFGFSMRFTEGVCSGGGMPSWIPTVMPSWVFITTFAENPYGDRIVLGHVPIDDENVMLVSIAYNLHKELGDMATRTQMGGIDPDNFVPASHDRDNNWNQDRDAMRNGSFTGIGMGMFSAGILLQDQAAIESMGKISDRTREQIGPADRGIFKGRQFYLDALKAHMEGKSAPGVGEDLSCVGHEGGVEYGSAA